MPMNPMQRRARNSFLIGFLVALIIMAVVVMLLLQKIKSINDAKEALEARQKKVLVAIEDLESGQAVTMDDFKTDTVQTSMDTSKIISSDDFEFTDTNGEIIAKYNDDGSEKQKQLIMKVSVPAGTMVTKEMLSEVDEQVTDDLRLQEFNMILLPSQLKNGDYIDVRYSLPGGEDYVVLAKKKVIATTQTGVWLKLSEEEVLTMENAIVEAYQITGSKLYALEYVEPGMQGALTPTYPVSQATLTIIQNTPNIVQEAKDAIFARYNDQGQVDQRVNHINSLLPEPEKGQSLVQSGNKDEQGKMQADRENFVKSLEGTEDIGVSSN